MSFTDFPNPRFAPPEGILAIGGTLDPVTLMAAYRQGIFPWSGAYFELAWFSPDPRAILRFAKLHTGARLARTRRRTKFTFTIDKAFQTVIKTCARIARRPDDAGTWITKDFIAGYTALHKMGLAHSVEAWDEGELVGGVYGVEIDGAFAGESMFHTRADASKLALLYLIEHLQARGLEWMDIQMMTPHLQALGAEEITRDDFLKLLAATRRKGIKLFAKQ